MADVMDAMARAETTDGAVSEEVAPPRPNHDEGQTLQQMKCQLQMLEQRQREWRAKQQSKLLQKTALERLLQGHGLVQAREKATPAVEGNKPQSAAESERENAIAMRKEELRQLQEQAIVVLKKQQHAATALTKKLERLNVRPAAGDAAAANKLLPSKRKRDDDQEEEGERKNAHVEKPKPVSLRAASKSAPLPTVPSKVHEYASLEAFIHLEKRAVEEVCDIALRGSPGERSQMQSLLDSFRQSIFLANLFGRSSPRKTPQSVYSALSESIGGNLLESSQQRRIRYHRFRQFSGLFIEMEAWLRAAKAKEEETTCSSSSVGANVSKKTAASSPAAASSRPFDLEQDSVFRQVRSLLPGAGQQKTKKMKKLDPMNMLCLYELSGICNDENCPYQHQKDFDSSEDESQSEHGAVAVEGPPGVAFLSREEITFLQDFAQLRSKIQRKWPLITGRDSTATASESTISRTNQDEPFSDKPSHPSNDGNTEEDGSFLQLENSDAMDWQMRETNNSECGSSRYYEADDDTAISRDALQKRVSADARDTDSWLLLAINQLGFEMNLSEDAIRISDSDRILEQLISLYRCVHLDSFSSSSSVIEESKLKLSLHTLSRALEIEENAYCETLWLLYLHLSSLLPTRDCDSEFEMAEQAIQLIPTSHQLWVHYIAVGKLESIQVSEALHCRILGHLSKPGSFGGRAGDASELSRLLVAIVLHLCVKLCHAGNRGRALELLAAVLQIKQPASALDWCEDVRGRLKHSDVAMLSMVYVHLLLFLEIPAHIVTWLHVSGHQQAHIPAFAYTAESFEQNRVRLDGLDEGEVRFALAAYELAFKSIEPRSVASDQFMDIILNNWVILVAFVDTRACSRSRGLDKFVEEYQGFVVRFPGASFTAAKLLADMQRQTLHAHQLMLDMMTQSSAKQFPEALHYYLYACRGFSESAETPDVEFPVLLDVIVRLSSDLDVNHQELEFSLAAIKADTNPFGKAKSLKKLLYGLLSAWMDQLAAAKTRQLPKQPEEHEREPADIYIALDICQLMSMLLEPSVAIDGLDMVLNSSKLKLLSSESRQLAWALRFIFQLDHSVREKPIPESFKLLRSALLQLFRKYMERMNTVTESITQASDRLAQAITQHGVQTAIVECLYPQHKPWSLLDGNLDIFQLCAAAIPTLELSTFFRSTHHWLSPSPAFCLAYADIAMHHWEWRKIRQGLAKCLRSTTTHDQALRALVALELKNRNVKGVAKILEKDLQMDPLSVEAWRLVVGMEILVGEHVAADSSLRSNELAEAISKRKLTLHANPYNDMELFNTPNDLLEEHQFTRAAASTTLRLSGWSIHRVPNAVFTMSRLTSLDLSGNLLVEIPESISRLSKLEVLNVSQNALLGLPASLAKLSELRVLDLSHNNLSGIPGTLWVHLVKLQELYLSANLIAHLPAPPLSRLQDLRILKIDNNVLLRENVAQIRELLAPTCAVSHMETNSANEEEQSSIESIDKVNSASVPESTVAPAQVESSEEKLVAADISNGIECGKEDVQYVGSNVQDASKELQEEQKHLDNSERTDVVDQVTPESPETTKSGQENVDIEPTDQPSASDAVSSTTETQETNGSNEDHPDHSSGDECPVSHATAQNEMSAQANGGLAPDELAIYNAAELTDKFEAYINEHHVNRSQVRHRNPPLWRKYVETQVQLHSGLGSCVMCDAPNDGWNQRFNTMVLCPSCLSYVVDMLQARASSSLVLVSESKENH